MTYANTLIKEEKEDSSSNSNSIVRKKTHNNIFEQILKEKSKEKKSDKKDKANKDDKIKNPNNPNNETSSLLTIKSNKKKDVYKIRRKGRPDDDDSIIQLSEKEQFSKIDLSVILKYFINLSLYFSLKFFIKSCTSFFL